MYLSGKHFKYSDTLSKTYKLILAHIDTEPIKAVSGEVAYNTTFSNTLKKKTINGQSWDESPLSQEVEIISEEPIAAENIRTIEKWLFNSPTYKKLYVDPDEDEEKETIGGVVKQQYVECIFKNPTIIEFASGVHGWKCTMDISSPMALQDSITQTFTSFTTDITISVDTDINDYTYPNMVVIFGNIEASTDFSIINKTDNNRTVQINDITASATLYIDSALGIITDSSDISQYSKVVNQKFLRLLPGDNVLSITGDVTSFQITWQNKRWFR